MSKLRSSVWEKALVAARAVVLASLLLAFAAPQVLAQAGTVSGVVVDRRVQPIAGAEVLIVGTQLRAMTDNDGRFRIGNVVGASVTLQVSRIGYRRLTSRGMTVGEEVRLVMSTSVISLDAIVITGTAGAVQKREIGNTVGTVDIIDAQQLAPAPDITAILNARTTGVSVVPGTGVIGAGPRINIRGQRSLSLSDQPLLYVDGVRVANTISGGPTSQGFGAGVISRLGDFHPDDIESIEVIKGPAAATLYGTEASNGVIQIITKRGRPGRTQLTAIVRQGATWFANAEGRIPHNFGDPGTGPGAGTIVEMDLLQQEKDRGTPIFATGHLQEYRLELTGGSSDVRYYLSGGYQRSEGIEETNLLDRFTMRTNLSATPAPTLAIDASLGVVRSKLNLADDIGFGSVFNTMYALPVLLNTPKRGFLVMPPDAARKARVASQSLDRTTSSMKLTHTPTSWLTHRLTLGLDETLEDNEAVRPNLPPDVAQFLSPLSARGFKQAEFRSIRYTTVDYNATVNANVSDAVSSATSAGAQYYRKRTEYVSSSGTEFPAPGLTSSVANAVTFGRDDFEVNTTVGFFVQQQFGLHNRAFVTAALRLDNNSAFGENFSLITYPKVSATWVINEEPFWNVGFVNALKLRMAYGQSGLQPESFAALRTFQAVTVGGDVAAVTPLFIGNPDLKPERSQEIEGGFETSLFDDRVGIDFSVYYTKTKDAILLRNQAPSLGFPGAQFINIGALRNQGFEVQVAASLVRAQKVDWNLGFTFSQNDNEILDLGDIGTIVVPSLLDTPGIVLHHQEGLPAGSWFGRKVLSATLDASGVAQNVMCDGGLPSGRPSGVEVDCAGAPDVYLGRSDPRNVGAVNTTVTLFNMLTLYAMLDFKLGVRHGDNDAVVRCQLFKICEENVFPERFDPVLVAQYQTGFLSTFAAADASYAMLREISASVRLPDGWVRAIGASRGQIVVSARNIHRFTSFPSIDPETLWLGTSVGLKPFTGTIRSFQFDKTTQAFTPQLMSFLTTLRLTF